tara:strand:+ start:33 stop:431 length:399 start_codon:yes stop_codon:yes gene_type:complete
MRILYNTNFAQIRFKGPSADIYYVPNATLSNQVNLIFRVVSKQQQEFEKLLDSKLRNNHLKTNISYSTARRVSEEILSQNAQMKAEMDKVMDCGDRYFRVFLRDLDGNLALSRDRDNFFRRRFWSGKLKGGV